MNIQQLDYIIAVDRFKSFTLAADYCHVTQATLSAMIKKLEEEFGVIIFDRKCNPILTTEIGHIMIEKAKAIAFHVQSLKDAVQSENIAVEGSLRIGIIPTIANGLLPKVIKPLLESYPKLHIEVIEITTQHILKQLKDGSIDLGIMATPIKNEDIECEVLYYEPLLVYGEISKKKKYILPSEIKNHKIWLLEEGHCLREQFINLCSLRKKIAIPTNLSFEANSFDTLLNMVDEFGGLTLIPELYFQSLSSERKKKVSLFNNPVPVREVSLIYFRPYAKKNSINAVASCIKTVLAKTFECVQKGRDMSIVKI
jgi:LysR family transcriptional regulator, hydrogen peroxide-inducible genes activator